MRADRQKELAEFPSLSSLQPASAEPQAEGHVRTELAGDRIWQAHLSISSHDLTRIPPINLTTTVPCFRMHFALAFAALPPRRLDTLPCAGASAPTSSHENSHFDHHCRSRHITEAVSHEARATVIPRFTTLSQTMLREDEPPSRLCGRSREACPPSRLDMARP